MNNLLYTFRLYRLRQMSDSDKRLAIASAYRYLFSLIDECHTSLRSTNTIIPENLGSGIRGESCFSEEVPDTWNGCRTRNSLLYFFFKLRKTVQLISISRNLYQCLSPQTTKKTLFKYLFPWKNAKESRDLDRSCFDSSQRNSPVTITQVDLLGDYGTCDHLS